MEKLNGLDLFSGIGGLSLALSEWVRPIAYCENDRYAQAVLLSRMHDGKIARAPIWDDVLTLTGEDIPDELDLIYGGFPCQDISVAGAGRGMDGERSGLFFQVVRLVEEINPAFVFLENVPAIRTRGLDRVIRAFTDIRYDCRWTCVSAAEVGAPHLRKRWFMLAHSYEPGLRDKSGRRLWSRRENKTIISDDGAQEPMADTESLRWGQGWSESEREQGRPSPACGGDPVESSTGIQSQTQDDQGQSSISGWWETEPDVGRVVDGIPQRVDRLRGLGNAVVPLQAKTAFERLMGL